jgi:hypothetical protein
MFVSPFCSAVPLFLISAVALFSFYGSCRFQGRLWVGLVLCPLAPLHSSTQGFPHYKVLRPFGLAVAFWCSVFSTFVGWKSTYKKDPAYDSTLRQLDCRAPNASTASVGYVFSINGASSCTASCSITIKSSTPVAGKHDARAAPLTLRSRRSIRVFPLGQSSCRTLHERPQSLLARNCFFVTALPQ